MLLADDGKARTKSPSDLAVGERTESPSDPDSNQGETMAEAGGAPSYAESAGRISPQRRVQHPTKKPNELTPPPMERMKSLRLR